MVDRPMAIWLKEVGFVFIPLQVNKFIFNGSTFGFCGLKFPLLELEN